MRKLAPLANSTNLSINPDAFASYTDAVNRGAPLAPSHLPSSQSNKEKKGVGGRESFAMGIV
jgi:hypothetical protein